MTSEEAIKYLKKMKDECNDKFHKVRYVTREEALDMAIKALEQEPKETWSIKDVATTFERHGLMTEQEPCEDCISRAEAQKRISIRLYESALNIVDYDCKTSDVFKDIAEKLSTCISEIPSIQPKPKTGHWTISPNDCFVSCSECGLHGDKGIYKHYRWCPNCGAKMESEG